MIEDERKYGVLRDVAGDVLFRVVRAHLLLIDVLLEDIAEDIRIDLVVFAQLSLVEMPAKFVEKGEQSFKGFIGNLNRRVLALELVNVKQAAIEVRNPTDERIEILLASTLPLTEPLME